MPGQLGNFIKNIGDLIIIPLPVNNFLNILSAAGNYIWNAKKLNDPNLSDEERASAIYNTITSPLSLIPIVGNIANIVGLATPYVQDVISGKKDPPSRGQDINSKINSIGNIPNQLISSNIFKNFFSKY
jgi:hypothetical protein